MSAFTDAVESYFSDMLGIPNGASILESAIDDKITTATDGLNGLPEGVVSIKGYGAVGDGVTDDTEAIQLALDSAAEGDVLFVPLGTFLISKPLYIHTPNLTIYGIGDGSFIDSYVVNSGFAMYVGPDDVTLPTTTVEGEVGLDCSGQPTDWNLNLYENVDLNLEGCSLATWDIRLYLNTGDTGNLFTCAASYGAVNSEVAYWKLSSNGDGHLRFDLLTSNGITTATVADAMTVDAMNDVRVAYNGSNIYIFVDGVLVKTEACTGTIVQGRANITVGPHGIAWPDTTAVNSVSCDCVITSFRVTKNSARSTSGYTPTGEKYDDDNPSTVVMLINFEDTYGPFFVGDRLGGGKTYHLPRSAPTSYVPIRLENLKIDGGVLARGAPTSIFRDLTFINGPYAINMQQECYSSTFDNVGHVGTTGTVFSVCIGGGSGDTRIIDLRVTPNADGLVVVNSSVRMLGGFFNGCPGKTAIILTQGTLLASFTGIGIGIADEGQLVPFEHGVYMAGFKRVHLIDCDFDLGLDAPALAYDDSENIEIDGGSLAVSPGGSAPIVEYISGVLPNQMYMRRINYVNESGHDRCDQASVVVADTDNCRGTFTVTEDATTGSVSFDVEQPDADYVVTVTPKLKTGACSADSALVDSIAQTTSGFTVTVQAAPGAAASGKIRTFNWEVSRGVG